MIKPCFLYLTMSKADSRKQFSERTALVSHFNCLTLMFLNTAWKQVQ